MRRMLMVRRLLALPAMIAIGLIAALAPFHPVEAQRSRLVVPPERTLEGSPILPAGTQVLPEGTVLILEMETQLESNRSRISDRFEATVATPIVDANGRTLVPQGAVVEGHVTNVEPAKWRSRSGIIGVSFDNILLDGRRTPIRGFLSPADARTRKQMDAEGNIKASGSRKRLFVFIGGGAGVGATVAAIAGTGVLAATGIGAAAGLTASLLMKGKDAVIEPGQRFGLELTQPLRVGPAWYSTTGRQTSILPVRPRTGGNIIPDSGSLGRPTPPRSGYGQTGYPTDPNMIRTSAGAVPVYDVRAERGADGYLRVFISAETQTNGWRIYTHHQMASNDTLEVRLRGFPPSSYAYRQVSHPSASTIIVQDANRVINRIVVHGSNGDRTVMVNPGGVFTPTTPTYTPPPVQSEPYRPGATGALPSDGSSINLGYPPPGTSGGSTAIPATPLPQNPPPAAAPNTLSGQATRVANDLELFRENYAAFIGMYRNNRTGAYESLGARRTTANEAQMLDNIGFMIESARRIASPATSAAQRRTDVQRLRDDYQVANTLWARISLSPDLNRRWQGIQQGVQSLIATAGR